MEAAIVRKRNKQKEKKNKGQEERKVEVLQKIQEEKEDDMVMEDAAPVTPPVTEKQGYPSGTIPSHLEPKTHKAGW